jgi:hypothetical protein
MARRWRTPCILYTHVCTFARDSTAACRIASWRDMGVHTDTVIVFDRVASHVMMSCKCCGDRFIGFYLITLHILQDLLSLSKMVQYTYIVAYSHIGIQAYRTEAVGTERHPA